MKQFVYRCRKRGVRVQELLACLDSVSLSDSPTEPIKDRMQYTLLLVLGKYPVDKLS